jgi:ubiquinone/menaquinone biosynthesis C-methylase UbiE
MRRAEDEREQLDGPLSRRDRDAALADIDRLSAWFGGTRLSLLAVGALLAAAPAGPRVPVVVDVGGGRGDFARRLVRAVRRRGGRVRVVLLDRDEQGLALAEGVCRACSEIVRVCADASVLPFRDGGVDVTVTSLVIHHLSPEAAAACLEAMRHAARLGVVVNDLLRTRLSWLLVLLATRLFARHPVARHDGPLSVRRAYAPDELRVLCEKAGWRRFTVRRHALLARVLAVAS